MKRLSLLVLLLLSFVLLTACGESAQDAPETEDASSMTSDETTGELPPPAVTDIDGDMAAGAEAPAGDSPATDSIDEPAAPEPEVIEQGPWSPDDFGYGVQVHGNATVGDATDTMRAVNHQLGMDWVKMQVQWWLVHPDPDVDQWFFYDSVVEEAHNSGLNLMISIVGAPAWTRADGTENGPPDDYNHYAQFLTELLQRYDGKVDAIEVWNEQNLDREWATANGVNPEDYVRFLQLANETIKAQDPNVIVISGALSPAGGGDWVSWIDDFEWLDRALAAGLLDHADCVGAHHNGYNIGPDITYEQAPSSPEAATAIFRGPFDNPHHSWSFKSTLDTYAEKIQAIDPNMKLCVTEFGWATSEGYDTYPTGFEFAQDNSLQEQSDFITQAFQQMVASDDVWLAFFFNYDFGNKGGGPTDDPVPYSVVDTQGVPRPAFDAVSSMEKPR